MTLEQFSHQLSSTEEVESLLGSPPELVIEKELSCLDAHMEAFVAESPFALLGTYDREGRCDVSPRGDQPAVARVIDRKTLIMADRPGNRRADSLRNIISTGRVGLLFLVPGLGETLRLNGRACVMRDEDKLSTFTMNGKRPLLGIGIEVEECFFQCAKALFRSQLWKAHPEHPHATSRHFAKMLIDQTGSSESVESLEQQIQESYDKRLY